MLKLCTNCEKARPHFEANYCKKCLCPLCSEFALSKPYSSNNTSFDYTICCECNIRLDAKADMSDSSSDSNSGDELEGNNGDELEGNNGDELEGNNGDERSSEKVENEVDQYQLSGSVVANENRNESSSEKGDLQVENEVDQNKLNEDDNIISNSDDEDVEYISTACEYLDPSIVVKIITKNLSRLGHDSYFESTNGELTIGSCRLLRNKIT